MHCTDIVDKFYDKIVHKYEKYIGQNVDNVIAELSKNHIILPYHLTDLRDNDIILWQRRKDKSAHVTGYKKHYFYFET